ncbi:hypothetical protein F2P81_017529 [Scophthalmus maximus]|uniref:Uncharacterized protein n=1 Tax=Scophthalmus maximus TaxID=52904 RepID=A0A6A4SEZ4_SCOMX|nr:hypothetical protein F2P81_017529 [Scophthalmus maximus]
MSVELTGGGSECPRRFTYTLPDSHGKTLALLDEVSRCDRKPPNRSSPNLASNARRVIKCISGDLRHSRSVQSGKEHICLLNVPPIILGERRAATDALNANDKSKIKGKSARERLRQIAGFALNPKYHSLCEQSQSDMASSVPSPRPGRLPPSLERRRSPP